MQPVAYNMQGEMIQTQTCRHNSEDDAKYATVVPICNDGAIDHKKGNKKGGAAFMGHVDQQRFDMVDFCLETEPQDVGRAAVLQGQGDQQLDKGEESDCLRQDKGGDAGSRAGGVAGR